MTITIYHNPACRPIVVTPKGARLCRPSEAVLDILPNPDIGEFTKEDGGLSGTAP
ncbi:hypothetical protein [Methylocystis echinoides]|uniref:Uncharacterized protein n=1 Tax=Methylocystis echinoides TaxID=29468 RepID=A0A9W6GZK0_9HYPH|nr:hypothetical protein [Methylocystis echinoides]GLI95821.1 hypothetical protein LMG27198_48130 [Methylocystis echinoides]